MAVKIPEDITRKNKKNARCPLANFPEFLARAEPGPILSLIKIIRSKKN